MSPSELFPAESMAITVALAQLRRGDAVSDNIAAACVLALGRITGIVDFHPATGYDLDGASR